MPNNYLAYWLQNKTENFAGNRPKHCAELRAFLWAALIYTPFPFCKAQLNCKIVKWCFHHTREKKSFGQKVFSSHRGRHGWGPYLFQEGGIFHNEGPRLCPHCSSRAVCLAGLTLGANTASLSWPNGSKPPSHLGWQVCWLKRCAGVGQRRRGKAYVVAHQSVGDT